MSNTVTKTERKQLTTDDVLPSPRTRTAPVADHAASAHTQKTIDGLEWICLPPFDEVLGDIPAAAWREPLEQGWKRVKQNPARSVWRAEIGRETFYLKYYVHDDWRGRLKRIWRGPASETEFQSGAYALEHGIAAVRPVGYCGVIQHADRTCSLLVTRAVEPAYPLSEYWEMLRADEKGDRCRADRMNLIDLLAKLIARAHQAGFLHPDMHAANILVHPLGRRRYEAVFVDLQNTRLGRPLTDMEIVRNLGQLNQWFRRHASIGDRLRFLRRYLRWRDEYEQEYRCARPLDLSFDRLVRALAENARRHAEQLWAKRDRRALRTGKYFARIRVGGLWSGLVFLESKRESAGSEASRMRLSSDWWRAQLRQPLRLLERSVVSESIPRSGNTWQSSTGQSDGLCKDSHSACVAKALLQTDYGPLRVIVKRPLARDWRRRLRLLFAPSRSMRGWRMGYALLNRDVPAARPLAMLERRIGPFVLDSLLITDAIGGAMELDAYVQQEYAARTPRDWHRHKLQLSEQLSRRLRQFAERGFVHRDCKAQNILATAKPELRLFWIDMDGVRRVGDASLRDELKALTRLHVSLLNTPGITRTDRVRFLKTYLARFGCDAMTLRDSLKQIDRATTFKLRAKRVRRKRKISKYGRD